MTVWDRDLNIWLSKNWHSSPKQSPSPPPNTWHFKGLFYTPMFKNHLNYGNIIFCWKIDTKQNVSHPKMVLVKKIMPRTLNFWLLKNWCPSPKQSPTNTWNLKSLSNTPKQCLSIMCGPLKNWSVKIYFVEKLMPSTVLSKNVPHARMNDFGQNIVPATNLSPFPRLTFSIQLLISV